MNALTVRNQALPIVFDPDRPDRTRKALLLLIGKYCRPAGSGRSIHEHPDLTALNWNPDDAERLKPFALQRVQELPDIRTLRHIRDHFETIWRGASGEEMTRVIVTRMLDAIPNARPPCPEAYVEAAIDVLSEPGDPPYAGFSPPVVAAAAREALRTIKFCPSIAELYQLCTAARASYRHVTSEVAHLLTMRCDAELVMLELGIPIEGDLDDTIDDMLEPA